jgi:two-component system, LuxR family, response regulator FixJ
MKMLSPCVYVVDDDSAVRNSLALLFKSIGLQVVTCDSAQSFLDDHAKDSCGCMLLDVRMPGMSGPGMQRELTRRGSILPVIFITGHADVSMAVEAMQQGAFDFIEKPFSDHDLIERVQRALRQNARELSQLSEVRTIRARYESLTPREREVLDHVARGSPNKIVAYDLSISQRTVEIHRARLMEKMHAPSLAHLVRMTRTLAAH